MFWDEPRRHRRRGGRRGRGSRNPLQVNPSPITPARGPNTTPVIDPPSGQTEQDGTGGEEAAEGDPAGVNRVQRKRKRRHRNKRKVSRVPIQPQQRRQRARRSRY